MLGNQINSENHRKNMFEKVHDRVAQGMGNLTEQKNKIRSIFTSPPRDVTRICSSGTGRTAICQQRK